ncbi:hypothetical protein BDK51DRAFT_34044 [Blyttiomyces helicus]|uniref:Uncharacterized protein n=1 Tax=Blyttiomyces helicus TaxID=388810 RepID=A0A4P9W8L9_9FUNG|nr:hypothetical protein BDK51DRAFT_34044 [Blyttiomyces helicus]|eukprot:RKO88472.1 hypothetical protein BDK51DRAFT_34044 [Blyttiomyces helicus]
MDCSSCSSPGGRWQLKGKPGGILGGGRIWRRAGLTNSLTLPNLLLPLPAPLFATFQWRWQNQLLRSARGRSMQGMREHKHLDLAVVSKNFQSSLIYDGVLSQALLPPKAAILASGYDINPASLGGLGICGKRSMESGVPMRAKGVENGILSQLWGAGMAGTEVSRQLDLQADGLSMERLCFDGDFDIGQWISAETDGEVVEAAAKSGCGRKGTLARVQDEAVCKHSRANGESPVASEAVTGVDKGYIGGWAARLCDQMTETSSLKWRQLCIIDDHLPDVSEHVRALGLVKLLVNCSVHSGGHCFNVEKDCSGSHERDRLLHPGSAHHIQDHGNALAHLCFAGRGVTLDQEHKMLDIVVVAAEQCEDMIADEEDEVLLVLLEGVAMSERDRPVVGDLDSCLVGRGDEERCGCHATDGGRVCVNHGGLFGGPEELQVQAIKGVFGLAALDRGQSWNSSFLMECIDGRVTLFEGCCRGAECGGMTLDELFARDEEVPVTGFVITGVDVGRISVDGLCASLEFSQRKWSDEHTKFHLNIGSPVEGDGVGHGWVDCDCSVDRWKRAKESMGLKRACATLFIAENNQ